MLAEVDAVTIISKPIQAVRKFFCHCLLEDDSEVFLAIRALNESHASKLVHDGYNIAFVLDIISPLQMEYRKRHLRPSVMIGQPLN